MPTTHKRINLTVDPKLYSQLRELKQIKKASSLSAIVIDLTRFALELQEDLYFSKIAEERAKEPVISHKKTWSAK